MVTVKGVDMSPNQVIIVAFISLVTLLTLFNYGFSFMMTKLLNVRYIEDRVPWSLSELGMIAFGVAGFYMMWFLVKLAQTVLSNMEENGKDTKEKDCLLSCVPSSFMGILTEFGIPFVVVMTMLLLMGKLHW